MNIPDIGTVEEDGHNSAADESTTYRLIKAHVIAVVLLDSYNSCISSCARVETTEPPLGRCSKCCMMQHIEHCAEQMIAKVIIKEEQGQWLNFQHLALCCSRYVWLEQTHRKCFCSHLLLKSLITHHWHCKIHVKQYTKFDQLSSHVLLVFCCNQL